MTTPNDNFFGSLAHAFSQNAPHIAAAIEEMKKCEGAMPTGISNAQIFGHIIDIMKDCVDPLITTCADVIQKFRWIQDLTSAVDIPYALSWIMIKHLEVMGCNTASLESSYLRSNPGFLLS